MTLKSLVSMPQARPGHCANCGSALPEPPPRFCSACGQETSLKPPSLLEFLQQFGGAYISTEGALWRTLWRLLLLPGQLTLEYFAGRRRHFVLPLRLYLTISVLALVAIRFSGVLDVEGKPENLIRFDTPRPTETFFEWGTHRAGLKEGEFYCEQLPAKLCERVQRRIKMDPEATAGLVRELPERFISNLGSAMFVMLPFFAFWLKLVYVDKRRRYTEHLVFALHLHAFWFAMALLLVSGVKPLVIGAAAAINVYPLIALHRVYRTRWWSTLLRAFVLLVAYTSTLSIGLAFVLLWAFFS
ncbi:DUF3667 domain-containing protein [Paucibacter soli]|uniref:DUF3667 domain-containing protein n=1 Tax=Paucibacter soli TaxID=3133433 RepID=UPI0030ABDBF5